MELVLVAHRRGATFEVGHITALVGDDQRAFELTGVLGVDAEVSGKLHRAAHAFGDVDERPVGKDRAVQCRKIIVVHRHDLAEPLFHQLRIFTDCFGYAAEDDARAFKFGAEGGGDGYAVEHRIDRHLARAFDPGEHFLLGNRDAEFLVNAQNFGIDLIERSELRLCLGLGVIISVLIIDRRHVELCPIGRLHRQPVAKRL